MTGWILTKSAAPLWMWVSICGADGLWAAILVTEGSATPRVWLTALAMAGAVGGAITGFQAGGAVTGSVWALVGACLGAIASSEAESKTVASVFAIAGVATVTGLIAGTGSGDWVRTLTGAICWGMLGLICGLITEVAVDADRPKGLAGLIGLGIGAWLGSGSGASSEALVQALGIAGSKTVYGAWAAIGIIAGVIAKMVVAERAIGPRKIFYTSTLLLATSGLGLWLGYWLGDRI